jgi:hypothetical protein
MPNIEGLHQRGGSEPGSEVNPIQITTDRTAAVTNLILRALSTAAGGLGAEMPGVSEDGRADYRTVPSEIEGAALDKELRAKVKPGQWFYFSTDPTNLYKQGPSGRPTEGRKRGSRDRFFLKYPNQPPLA